MSPPARARALLALALAITAALAWLARDVDGLRRPFPPGAAKEAVPAELAATGWFSIDPDGLYHARRVERALREGAVAERDPYLNHPHGAPIPWPPYYDALLAAGLGPLAPSGDGSLERRAFLEHGVATLPALFGLGAAVLAAALAFRLARGAGLAARTAGALAAGATVALCRASINYSAVGGGDHHAWVALLDAALLLVLTVACCRSNLARPGRSLALGALAGALAGLMLGSWVAALLHVIAVQLALAWLLFRRARLELPGLARFGLAFHLTAAVAILPAVRSSPWREELPWMAVNLSWLHPTLLSIGALVFVPPLAAGGAGRALACGSPWARRYPWLVGALLAGGAALLWVTGAAPARGVAEGFAWVSRADAFMDTVLESRPLVGPRAGGWGTPFEALGYGLLLLPVAWVALALCAFRRDRLAFVPLAVALPPLVLQALAQRRFAEALAMPLAACLGWAAARLVEGLRRRPAAARLPGAVWAGAALALALALQWPSLERALAQRAGPSGAGGPNDYLLGDRLAYDWIRRRPRREGADAVLAHWDRGHALEWAADRPTVATNFGSYVGLESYRDPARFFLSEDPLEGRALLERRGVQFVFVPGSLPASVESFVRIADPGLAPRYLTLQEGRVVTSPRWLSTLGARLLNGGAQLVPPGVPEEQHPSPPGFLRLVHVSPFRQPHFQDPATRRAMPACLVYEHVPGATVAARGGPEEPVRVELELVYPAADHRLELVFRARCDAGGVARLWIPYATGSDAANGDARVERARWTIGARSGPLVIPESAVQGGPAVRIP